MRKISADYVIRVSQPPVQNGVLIIEDDGRIRLIDERKNFQDADLEIFSGIICPGFINSHCHLELSYLKDRIPEHTGLVNFISTILKIRNDQEPGVQEAIANAEDEMLRNGIVAVGDISNAVTSFHQKSKWRLQYQTFVECFGLASEKAEEHFNRSKIVFQEARRLGLDVSLTPHAPFTMSAELFEEIFSFHENHPPIFSYHNQESEEENKLYQNGTGDFLKLYKELHFPFVYNRKGASSIKANLHFFPEQEKILFVHNSFTSADDASFVMSQRPDSYWCFCPNANLYIENSLPQFQNFLAYPDRLCLGTDSYVSNHQLSILEEMKTIQHHHPVFSTEQLIQWATLNPATFFGWERNFGSIEVGKKAGLNLITGLKNGTQLDSKSQVQRIC